MIYCPSCGIANREGSRFCNECGAKLPTSTSVRCPQCGSPNAPNTIFCEKCGTRLIAPLAPDEPDEPEPTPVKKGLSLPSKLSPAPASDDEDIPDWLSQLAGDTPASSPDTPAETARDGAARNEETPPDWLSNLMAAQPAPDQPPAVDQPAADETPDWLTNLRPATSEDVPDWLNQLDANQVAAASEAEEETPEWLRQLSVAADVPAEPETPATPALPSGLDWSQALREAAAESESPLADDVPDWLSGLGAAAESPEAEPAAAIEPAPLPDVPETPADDLPDWLGHLDQPEAPAAPVEESRPQTDWLGQLRAAAPVLEEEPAAEDDQSAAQPAASADAEWLSALGVAGPADARDQSPPASVEEPSAEGGIPDWLSALGLAAPTAEPGQPAEPPAWSSEQAESTAEVSPAAELPDWLTTADQGIAEVPEGEESKPQADWLGQLRAAAPLPEDEYAAEEVVHAADETPDWVRDLGPSPDRPVTDEDKPQTDWLGQLRAAAPLLEEDSADEESAPAELPAWLTTDSEPKTDSLSTGRPGDEAETPDWARDLGLSVGATAAAGAVSDIPDWLRSSEGSVPTETPEALQPMRDQAAEEIPDWLHASDQIASVDESEGRPPEPISTLTDDEIPDWLRSVAVSAEEAEPSLPVETPAAQIEGEDVPDWLRPVRETAVADQAEQAALEPATATGTPEWLQTLDVSGIGAEAATEPGSEWPSGAQGSIEPPETAEIEAGEIPSWLTALRPEEAAPSSTSGPVSEEEPMRLDVEVSKEGPAAAELPEWLTSLRERRPAAPTQPAEAQPPVPGLTQAEIPAWLEALRPTGGEGAGQPAPDEAGEVEKEGILAGVAQVLPPAPLMGEVQGQPTRLNVEISAEDIARAGVLQQLLSRGASMPQAAPPLPGYAAARRPVQWLLAALLLAAVIVPFLLPSRLSILPQVQTLPASPLLRQAVSQVAALPSAANVLVVFDYDATQAGEMDQLADALLRHLLARNANLTAVSLNPIGPGLAQTAWDAIEPELRSQGAWRNLGYVAGQSIGVQDALLKAGPVDLVVELAASPDALRWWVEQRQAIGHPAPLIAGVSAAAESLTLPYAQSRQVAGLISGAAGATVYAREAAVLTPETTAMKQVQLESLTLANWLMAVIVLIALAAVLFGRTRKGGPA